MTDLEQFAERARSWLAANADKYAPSGTADPAESRAFRMALWDAGFLGITLDPAYGGQGLTNAYQKAFNEEMASYRLPPTSEAVTTGICAPTLLDFGTEDQKRCHIARMIRGEETWTQLLSEPGAGSDLAGLQTRALRDGDEYVIDGQKVWTSGARSSDFALCMARTNPERSQASGIVDVHRRSLVARRHHPSPQADERRLALQ